LVVYTNRLEILVGDAYRMKILQSAGCFCKLQGVSGSGSWEGKQRSDVRGEGG